MPAGTVNDIALNYELHGDSGEPLVFVHGYTGDITDWRFQIPEFCPTHRVLVMDLRGHGASDAPASRDAYSIEQMADDVEALIDRVGFDRYHLLGHSMGGAIAQEIALRSPERVITLTLEDTGAKLAGDPDDDIARYTAGRVQIALEEGMEALANRSANLEPPPYLPAARLAEERERLTRMSVDAFVGAAHAIREWPGARDRVSAIEIPTLIICGELDAPVLFKASQELAELIPNAKLTIVPQAAHSPQYERPDLFNRALREHIEKQAETTG